MKARMGSGGYSSTFSLTSSLDGVSLQHHAPAAFSAGNRIRIRCIGGWVDPRAVRDLYGKSSFHQVSNAGPIQPEASRCID